MFVFCIACDERYIYTDGDEDCTQFLCSYCIREKPNQLAGKWERLRFRILNRDDFTCRYCGDSPLKSIICTLHVDHIKAISHFGTNAETNLIAVCQVCNYGKLNFDLTPDARRKVDEYTSSSKPRLSRDYKSPQREGFEQMENLKRDVRIMADSKHVGARHVQTKTGQDGKAKEDAQCEKQLAWRFAFS